VEALDVLSDETSDDAKCPLKRKRKQLNLLRKLLQLQINKILTMHSISKNIYLALNGLYSEVCRLNSMEQIIQRMPRNLHKKESISTDHPMEGKMEHNARDATRHSENKVRVIFLVLKRHLYEA
jgi:hypothetical protein